MTDRKPRLIQCALCRKSPNIIDDWAGGAPELGHYEIDCGCGVYVWAPKLEDAAELWNRLMRRARR